MTRSKGWFITATVFTAINVLGAPYALFSGEWMHFFLHVTLGAVGALFMWRFAGGSARADTTPNRAVAPERLAELQQSVDAIALEVERIGESQRYAAKLVQERAAERAAAEKRRTDGDAERK